MNRWHKIYSGIWQSAGRWENYLLLTRTLHAAWLVRRQLTDNRSSPQLAAAIQAVKVLYLPAQSGWSGPTANTVMRFAGFVTGVPRSWGRCVQRSLIAYRLLNGYGIPARVCFGIHRADQARDGHAWVEILTELPTVLGEQRDPYENYLPVYASPLPHAANRS